MPSAHTSLVAVTAFGLTTAASYAWSGLISWKLAGLFIAGGAFASEKPSEDVHVELAYLADVVRTIRAVDKWMYIR